MTTTAASPHIETIIRLTEDINRGDLTVADRDRKIAERLTAIGDSGATAWKLATAEGMPISYGTLQDLVRRAKERCAA